MKNIHIIPTDQPTGIFETNSGLQFSIMNKVRHGEFKGFHIYITSDEELPYDDSIFATGAFYHRDAAKDIHIITKDTFHPNPNFCSRIILTTDDSLFKYGVQAIDDEFLKWFVKKPSCDFVETFIDTMRCVLENCTAYPCINYKIIIPKEEPKHDFSEEYQDERMYSEKEVYELLKNYQSNYSYANNEIGLKKWFEQVKKK